MNVGKCPRCGSAIAKLSVERVEVAEGEKTAWRGITLICPDCSVVLGAAIDPLDLKDFVAEEVVHKLRSVQ